LQPLKNIRYIFAAFNLLVFLSVLGITSYAAITSEDAYPASNGERAVIHQKHSSNPDGPSQQISESSETETENESDHEAAFLLLPFLLALAGSNDAQCSTAQFSLSDESLSEPIYIQVHNLRI
jgi:hypothetical protein